MVHSQLVVMGWLGTTPFVQTTLCNALSEVTHRATSSKGTSADLLFGANLFFGARGEGSSHFPYIWGEKNENYIVRLSNLPTILMTEFHVIDEFRDFTLSVSAGIESGTRAISPHACSFHSLRHCQASSLHRLSLHCV